MSRAIIAAMSTVVGLAFSPHVKAAHAQRLYTFTHPLRPTSFIAEYYQEPAAVRPPDPAAPPQQPGSSGVVIIPPPSVAVPAKRYCVASVPFIDGAMTVDADPASAVPDVLRSNNLIIVR